MRNNFVFFWGGIYSNFYPCSFNVDNVEYNCSEQYFMAQKALFFNDEVAYNNILKAKTPKEQKAIGRTIKNFDVDKWSSVSRDYMYKGVYAKFSQNKHLLKALISNKGKEFVESSPEDKIWGIGLHESNPLAWNKETWEGSNWLGETITKVMNNLIKEQL